ncbi:MAG: AAA family ATPase [Clostridia bacterium]|nr:AAA family ATPase [Clostridia bacterium]
MNVILICGLNGSGKTTLGRELANALGFKFLNDEEYYFLESEIPFSKSRSDEAARDYIISFIKQHKNVVIVSSCGDLGSTINSFYDLVVYLYAPLDIRLSRIEKRECDRFSDRVKPGGDMYNQQMEFRNFVATRSPEKIEKWLSALSCKVIKSDGTKPIQHNVEFLKSQL